MRTRAVECQCYVIAAAQAARPLFAPCMECARKSCMYITFRIADVTRPKVELSRSEPKSETAPKGESRPRARPGCTTRTATDANPGDTP